MDFEKKYKDYLQIVERRIDEIARVKEPKSLYEPFNYLMSGGGKRIRPILTMFAAETVGGDPRQIVDAAVAIEIMHNFTLAHDDIMDRSPLRRGRETVHKKWNEAAAILVGDAMVGFGYSLLGNLAKNPNYSKIVHAYTEGLIQVCEGQAYDMDFNGHREVELADYYMMIDKKTAKLLECCVAVGAYAGGGSDTDVAALKNYAHSLGIAFQIQDDMLDLKADESKLGKKVGQDIIEGKRTFLIITARDKAHEMNQMSLLDRFFEQNGMKEAFISDFKRLFEDLEVFEDGQKEIETRMLSAKNAVSGFPDNDGRKALLGLLEKLNKRAY